MKIALIHDFAKEEVSGGADLTLTRLVEFAPRGILFRWLTFRNKFQLNYYDTFVIASHRTSSPIQLETVLEGKKYVKIFLDYHYVAPKIIRDAQLLVYMSLKQREDMLGKFTGYNSYVMPSLVDPDRFSSAKKSGKGHLWVGSYSRQKGIRNLWEWAEDNQVHVDCYGHGTPRTYLERSEFCHVRMPVPYSEMPTLYKEYETLVHLPKGPEAGSRVFIEAVLSGLSVVTNSMEGDLSYEEPFNAHRWRERLRTAPAKFWEAAITILQT